MSKENLFEDMTAEEMRQRLQEVSEYMDGLIEGCRRKAKQYGEDVTEYELFDVAHDVLEIVHSVGTPIEFKDGSITKELKRLLEPLKSFSTVDLPKPGEWEVEEVKFPEVNLRGERFDLAGIIQEMINKSLEGHIQCHHQEVNPGAATNIHIHNSDCNPRYLGRKLAKLIQEEMQRTSKTGW